MSSPVELTTNEVPYIHNQNDWNLLNNNKWYYKLQATITGSGKNIETKTKILRSYKSGGNFIVIGTYNDNKIELNDKARENEIEAYQIASNETWTRTIQTTLWNNLQTLIGGSDLSSSEQKQVAEQVVGKTRANTVSNDKTNQSSPTQVPAAWEITTTKINTGAGIINTISIKGNRRSTYDKLYYPSTLESNKQDRIRFEQLYTEGTKLQTTFATGVKQFQRKQKKLTGSVTLPIVTGIEDTNRVDWKSQTLNPIQALGAAGALGVFQGAQGGQDLETILGNVGTQLNTIKGELMDKTAGGDVRSGINVWLAQQAVGAQNLLSRTTGAIVNPNLEMLFGGPQLRSFAFSFTLSPRDANEADHVRKIIRFFKQGMSVKTSSSNVFLKAPNIFRIRYQTFNTNGDEIVHPSINMIKECAMTDCNVRYTPNNTYMTYEDPFRTMQSYQLTLSFGELDPIYDDDYTDLDNNNDQAIGY